MATDPKTRPPAGFQKWAGGEKKPLGNILFDIYRNEHLYHQVHICKHLLCQSLDTHGKSPFWLFKFGEGNIGNSFLSLSIFAWSVMALVVTEKD